ncbi:class I mannose-6-phosphate isomerase [Sphingomonas sp. HITSZ_GF]|uniref:class I mannose-6-phosphate isomerase n=1 Tax=Sphingomonas sp. HITSZ_GF TaxID=3037247 RepID=UPI00240E4596|nr:class I mannose-6-phosphate isomerase [Sphingomonas sp. HITSZ_GF]MDG2535028.1 class I mannose-6-phosphate isomerase [Sphingomonas sp. HITSZ_GF]
MTATLLATHRVEKPWGRHTLWPGFADPAPGGEPVGEIWFQTPGNDSPDLLIKYLFTSEKLSVQVHPDDAQARAAGYPRGKDECWVVLAAEPDATIGLGTIRPVPSDELRTASLDGSVEHLLDWKPVKAGDFIYSPARTVHAIGAGVTVIEIQQNVDLTYRLYDYGRPRELHLEEAVAAADAKPFEPAPAPANQSNERKILVEGPKFVVERLPGGHHRIELPEGTPGWFVPVTGRGVADGVPWQAGECLLLDGMCEIEAEMGSDLLFAYPGSQRL